MPTYNDALDEYVRQTFAGEGDALRRIRLGIEAAGLPAITIRPDEGRFLQFMVAATAAKLAVEIGTLGGYSGTWIASGLGDGGRLITLEQVPARAELAREHFRMAGVADRVELLVGDAHELLPKLSPAGPFDFVFIDAEKEGYQAYLDWTLDNLRPGGVLAAHNAFRGGAIVNPDGDEATRAIRQFNLRLARQPDLISTIYPAGDGMALAVKRPAA